MIHEEIPRNGLSRRSEILLTALLLVIYITFIIIKICSKKG